MMSLECASSRRVCRKPGPSDGDCSRRHQVTVHWSPNPDPATFIYRARYVDKKLYYGNFGDPVECTVSV